MPSKRTRWEVFRRDDFTCYYCKARDVPIELDHVVPQALGGPDDNDPAHYVTACVPCNRGKTSTSPGAPLVAAVAEDAVRWAKAMRAAQDQMLEDVKGRMAERAQFDEWWRAWAYGSGETRQEVAKDPGWELTVDQIVSAGLPLSVLKDCISIAMTRGKVLPENKFRYMCGIAWTKVRQLQLNAKRILDGDAPVPVYADGDAGYDQGRLDLARELFEQLPEDEQKYILERIDASELTEADVMAEAVDWAFHRPRECLQWLLDRIDAAGDCLPSDARLGAHRLAQAMSYGTETLENLVIQAVCITARMADILNLPAATAFLAAMSAGERDEWRAYAIAMNSDRELSEDEVILRAAECAREIQGLPGGWRLLYPFDIRHMCEGPGRLIPRCPQRGEFGVQVSEFDCCNAEDPWHDAHPYCEYHLGLMVDGAYRDGGGRSLTARDYGPARNGAPF